MARAIPAQKIRSNLRCLEPADIVYQRGSDLRPVSVIVLGSTGNSDTDDRSVSRRHIVQNHCHTPDTTVNTKIDPNTTLVDSELDVHNGPLCRSPLCLAVQLHRDYS